MEKAVDILILISKLWTVRILYNYMKHLYQMNNYINWLTTCYTNKQLFSICYNLVTPYIQIHQALKYLQDDDRATASSETFALAPWFWTTKMCLMAGKIYKICLFGFPNGRSSSRKANFENYCRYSLIK